ncbi:hypothetical protein [Roseovarius sp.]|uniref:hypothetical protein n=2 Tax=Roseovarius TaxID=74030 RepID=UPI0035631E5F
MFSWHSLVLVVVMVLTMLGVDIHLQAQKSGVAIRELGIAGYRETIRARIDGPGEGRVARQAREAREAERRPQGGWPVMDMIAHAINNATPEGRADPVQPVSQPPESPRAGHGTTPARTPETTPQVKADGTTDANTPKWFKAGVAVCTTRGGIKRCRIGG